MDGMKLSPSVQFTWSVVFFLFPGAFFFHMFFFPGSHSFLGAFFSLAYFFCLTILEPKFLSRELLPTLPTYLPTSLPPPNPSSSPAYPTTHLDSPPSPEPHRAVGACGELMELAKLVEVGELVESLWNLQKFWSLESLWNLWKFWSLESLWRSGS